MGNYDVFNADGAYGEVTRSMIGKEEFGRLECVGVGCGSLGHCWGRESSVAPLLSFPVAATNRSLRSWGGCPRGLSATQRLQATIQMPDDMEATQAFGSPDAPPSSRGLARTSDIPWITFERSPVQAKKIAPYIADSNCVTWMKEGLWISEDGWSQECDHRPWKAIRRSQNCPGYESAVLLSTDSLIGQERGIVSVLVSSKEGAGAQGRSKLSAGAKKDSACAIGHGASPHCRSYGEGGATAVVEIQCEDTCVSPSRVYTRPRDEESPMKMKRQKGDYPNGSESARRSRDLNPHSPADARSCCLSAADTAHRSCGESIKAASADDHTVWTEAETFLARLQSSPQDLRCELGGREDDDLPADMHEAMLQNPSECKLVEGVKEHFRIVKKLGSGGFATVYKAYCLKLKKYVALKVFQNCLDLTQCKTEALHLRRFGGGEHSIVSPVNVPPIAPRGGFLVHGYIQVLCLPFVEHDDPNIFIVEGLQTHEIRAYLKNLFEALAHLHEHEILHRDVKPGNYLYSRKEGRGVLIDFGLAERRKNGGAESHMPAAAPGTAEAGCKRKRAFALASEAWRAKQENYNNILKGNSTARTQPAGKSVTLMHPQRMFRMPTTLRALGLKLPQGAGGHGGALDGTGAGKGGGAAHRPPQVQQTRDGKRKKEPRANQAGTKGWRAPEVLLKSQKQTTAIDIWSVGIVMLCLLSRKYPFFECTDNVTNLGQIMSLRHHIASMDDVRDSCGNKTGRRADKLQEFSEQHNLHLGMGDVCLGYQDLARSRGLTWKTLLEQVCRTCGKQCCHLQRMGLHDGHPIWDLLDRCLDIDPRSRISARTALCHPFFQECT